MTEVTYEVTKVGLNAFSLTVNGKKTYHTKEGIESLRWACEVALMDNDEDFSKFVEEVTNG
jgi:hypothetical protein